MNKSAPFVKVLVFAAYMLAMLVPGWTMVGEQTQAEHAQMMAMASHISGITDRMMPMLVAVVRVAAE